MRGWGLSVLLGLFLMGSASCGGESGAAADSGGSAEDVLQGEDWGAGEDLLTTDLGQSEDATAGEDLPPLPEDVGEEPVPAGGVIVWQAESDYLNRANAQAGFQWYTAPVAPERSFGPCAVIYADPDAPAAVPQSLDAGVIEVTGTTPPVTLSFQTGLPGGGQGYLSSLPEGNESLHPAAGEPVTVTAAGGADLPAFLITAPTPVPVAISAPGGGLWDTIEDDEDLLITWNAATAHQVVLSVSALSGQGDPVAGGTLLCTLDGDPGTYTIPAAALAVLPTGAGLRALVSVSRVITTPKALLAGEVTLAVTASSGVAPLLR